jgi:hypothetical protein
MIEEFKRADGRGLGFEKLGEKVGEKRGESVYDKCVLLPIFRYQIESRDDIPFKRGRL